MIRSVVIKQARGVLALLALALACAGAQAQWKPGGQVEIVVPNAPGGGNDTLARLMQKVFSDARILDAASVVANKPGGAGNVALAYLGQRPRDGQTLAIVSVTQQLNYIAGTSTMRQQDYTTVATLLGDFVGYAVRADSPIKSGADMMEALKKDPGSLAIGLTAVGGNNHIALVLAARSAGVDAKRLKTPAFQSTGESITALLGGHIAMVAGSVGPLRPHIEAGRLRLIAVSSEQRLAGAFAQVPTWKEQGVAGTFNTWRGLWGPRGMSAEHLAFWDKALAQLGQAEEWKQALEKNGWVNDVRPSREATRYLEQLNNDLREAMKEIGLAKNL